MFLLLSRGQGIPSEEQRVLPPGKCDSVGTFLRRFIPGRTRDLRSAEDPSRPVVLLDYRPEAHRRGIVGIANTGAVLDAVPKYLRPVFQKVPTEFQHTAVLDQHCSQIALHSPVRTLRYVVVGVRGGNLHAQSLNGVFDLALHLRSHKRSVTFCSLLVYFYLRAQQYRKTIIIYQFPFRVDSLSRIIIIK